MQLAHPKPYTHHLPKFHTQSDHVLVSVTICRNCPLMAPLKRGGRCRRPAARPGAPVALPGAALSPAGGVQERAGQLPGLSRGKSLRETARLAGIDPAHLSRVERGQRNLSVEALARVAGVLGLTELATLLAPYRDRS